MQDTVKVFHRETKNNIFQFGFKVTAKTSYEQQEERRNNLIYMTIQKALASLLITIGIILTLSTKEGSIVFVCLMIGIPVLLTNKHVVMI